MGAYYDEEGHGVWTQDDGLADCGASEIISVRFSVESGQTRGRILQDVRGKARTKIVFVDRGWAGPKPTHGQELRVRVERDTNEHDPRRGVLFVTRVLPTAKRGGHHARCSVCGTYDVPLYNYREIGRNAYGTKMLTATSLTHAACEKCGTFHKIEL